VNVVASFHVRTASGAVVVSLGLRGLQGSFGFGLSPDDALLLGRELLLASGLSFEDLLSLRQMGEGEVDGVAGAAAGVHGDVLRSKDDGLSVAENWASFCRNAEGGFR
jgi:hypothetical protein